MFVGVLSLSPFESMLSLLCRPSRIPPVPDMDSLFHRPVPVGWVMESILPASSALVCRGRSMDGCSQPVVRSLRLTIGAVSRSPSPARWRCGVCVPTGFSSSLISSSDSYIVIKSPAGLQGIVRCLLVLLITLFLVGVGVVFEICESSPPGVSRPGVG